MFVIAVQCILPLVDYFGSKPFYSIADRTFEEGK